jgi:hypothetical protein
VNGRLDGLGDGVGEDAGDGAAHLIAQGAERPVQTAQALDQGPVGRAEQGYE